MSPGGAPARSQRATVRDRHPAADPSVPVEPSLTDTLCTRCGLCCDGTLFADVELAGRREATALEAMGLEIEDGDGNAALLVQPCGALRGTRCAIYAHRPQCCRTFECRLLQDVRRGAVDEAWAAERIADVRKRIGRTRERLAPAGHLDDGLPLMERCAEALTNGSGGHPEKDRTQAELRAAMAGVEALIRESFLKSGAPGRGRR